MSWSDLTEEDVKAWDKLSIIAIEGVFMSEFTDLQLVDKYHQLKATVAKRKEVFETEIKPYQDGMAVIENVILERLNERGAQNTKTEAGTAYKSELLNVKVVDRNKLLAFCTDRWDDIGSELLYVGAVKDAVRKWINDNGGEPPPGVDISYYTNINIRKT